MRRSFITYKYCVRRWEPEDFIKGIRQSAPQIDIRADTPTYTEILSPLRSPDSDGSERSVTSTRHRLWFAHQILRTRGRSSGSSLRGALRSQTRPASKPLSGWHRQWSRNTASQDASRARRWRVCLWLFISRDLAAVSRSFYRFSLTLPPRLGPASSTRTITATNLLLIRIRRCI